MADSAPNYKVEQQRLRAQRIAQLANIEKQRLDILEMADRCRRHLDNIASAEAAIGEIDKKLAGLETTHGALTDKELDAAVELVTKE